MLVDIVVVEVGLVDVLADSVVVVLMVFFGVVESV